ncbi:SAM-dependent methyltransferase [Acrocarpospora sp. B8E8]|uniref:SAM-dependent methyltransferase n=1 Tax=Acrocarpospora sp. B8E8 TaxID=3153572 RepID=UPI00325E486D
MPNLAITARAERQFIGRGAGHLAGPAGIDQFLDIGTGIPTADNTHQVAQRVNPAARTVYVHHDPLALVHAWALLIGSPAGSIDYIDADLGNPEPILQAATDTLDFAWPIAIALMLIGVQFVSDGSEWATGSRYAGSPLVSSGRSTFSGSPAAWAG